MMQRKSWSTRAGGLSKVEEACRLADLALKSQLPELVEGVKRNDERWPMATGRSDGGTVRCCRWVRGLSQNAQRGPL